MKKHLFQVEYPNGQTQNFIIAATTPAEAMFKAEAIPEVKSHSKAGATITYVKEI